MIATPASISAIVVSYNVAALLRLCLASLCAARDAGELSEIIVVDSSSMDGSVELARREFPEIVIEVVPNRGFGAAVNVGMARATGDALLILNPDTEVCPGAAATLARALFAGASVGAVGPRLVYPNGIEQPTRRRFPSRWTPIFESTVLEDWFPRNRWVRSYRMLESAEADVERARSVDWLVGAALMIKREVVDITGGFDDSFFLYGEELEWCHRIRRHGWEIHYVPEATIVHHEGASTSQDRLGSRLAFDRGRVRAQRALHGRAVARRTAWLLKLNFGIQLLREALKWVVGHRRDLRRRRIAQYWTLLKSRLDE